jgi:hypothetical protein
MSLQQRLLGVLLLVTLMSGCSASTLTVTADYDSSEDFSGVKTYAWMPESPHPTGDPKVDDNRLLHVRIRNTVNRELTAKGYVEQPFGASDVLVGYHVTVDEKTSIRILNNYYGYEEGWGWSYAYRTGKPYSQIGPAETVDYTYDEGTLILDIAEPEPRKLIWRGVVKTEVDFSANAKTRQERINKAVKQLIDQFPPK